MVLAYRGSAAAKGDDSRCSSDGGQSHWSVAALQHAADLACQGVLQALMLCHAGIPLLSAPEQALQLPMCHSHPASLCR